LKGILPANDSFEGGDSPYLLQIGLFSKVEGTHILLQSKSCVLEAAASSIWFPMRINLGFERNTSWNLNVSTWRMAPFAPNRSVRKLKKNMCLSEENHLC
jgi:hypothetical protein